MKEKKNIISILIINALLLESLSDSVFNIYTSIKLFPHSHTDRLSSIHSQTLTHYTTSLTDWPT